MKEFIEKIIQNLQTNGFPAKKVSLPTDKMYEAADKRGISFNKVLDVMKSDYSIDAQVGSDKIVFSQSNQDMIRQAQEMMSKMDPAELRLLQEKFANMTPEEKAEIMKKGRELGLL